MNASDPTPTITDFMTDGSLAALCASASRLIGVGVELRDAQGAIIASAPGHSPPWRVHGRTSESGATAAPSEDCVAIAAAPAACQASFIAPIRISAGTIGALALKRFGASSVAGAPQKSQIEIERFLTLLASTVSEICAKQAQLSMKVRQFKALHRLSSMLVCEHDLDATLDAALALAVDVIGVDAGSIRIIDEEKLAAQLRASIGLGQTYVHEAGALPAQNVLKVLGDIDQVHVAQDLQREPDLLHPEAVAREGLRSAMSATLFFQRRPIGVFRLYARTLREFTDAEQELLRAMAEQTAAAIENARLLEAERRSRQVDRQLCMARDVQVRMLPRAAPSDAALDIAWRWESSLELGGDFLDVFETHGGLGLAVGDVVGKGVPAALLMASVRATLRAHARDDIALEEVVARSNQALCRDTLVNEFTTLFFGVVDPATLRLAYCSAGHEPALVVRVPEHRAPCGADVDELRTGGMVLGVDPSQRYQQGEFLLRPSDTLVVFSDGLTEAFDFGGQQFGRRRVKSAILDLLALEPDASAQRIANHLLWEIRRFVGLNRQSDDMTILVVRAR